MSLISITPLLDKVPKGHQRAIRELISSFPVKYRDPFSPLYGTDHNVLVKEVHSRKKGGDLERLPFKFDGNRLSKPEKLVTKYTTEDLQTVEALGWHIFGPDTYGSYIDDTTLDHLQRGKEIENLKKQKRLVEANANCCLFLGSPGSKAKPLVLSDGQEVPADWSIFFASPYCLSKGSMAFFNKSKSSAARESKEVSFYRTGAISVYNGYRLNIVGCTNISEVSNCSRTDFIKTRDVKSFRDLSGGIVIEGKELPWYTAWYKAVTGKHSIDTIKRKLDEVSKPKPEATLTSNDSKEPVKK